MIQHTPAPTPPHDEPFHAPPARYTPHPKPQKGVSAPKRPPMQKG